MPPSPHFSGAKIAVICNGELLTYQRDNTPTIPWPGLWDLPGGGREADETPVQCALRETEEEFGLTLDPACILWTRVYPGQGMQGLDTWFFVAEVPLGTFSQVVFGDEGQRWEVTTVEEFLARNDAIVPLQQRLREFFVRSESLTADGPGPPLRQHAVSERPLQREHQVRGSPYSSNTVV